MPFDAEIASIHALTHESAGPLAVAVSGGSDSIALLRFAAHTAQKQRKALIAATVDHALRAESAGEAAWVEAQCDALGAALKMSIRHETLEWNGAKPTTGMPAAARQARYSLLAAWARAHEVDRILIGHTLDDQAETVAFRIASGAGIHGAAGLRSLSVCPVWPEGRGVLLARPLLDVRRAQLQTWLREKGANWLSDPTNEDQHYARPRMRMRLGAYATHAPNIATRFAAIGAKLSTAQCAIETQALALLQRHLRFDDYGAGLLALPPLQGADRDVRSAALSLAILAASGEQRPPSHVQVQEAWIKLQANDCAVSLGGARVGRLGKVHDHALLITRDPGAAAGRADTGAPADLTLRPGESAIFDGRFELIAPPNLIGPARICALGPDARRGLYASQSMKQALKTAHAHARPALPQIFFSGGTDAPTLPTFNTDTMAYASEHTEIPKILARFLGEDRLASLRVSLTRGQAASL